MAWLNAFTKEPAAHLHHQEGSHWDHGANISQRTGQPEDGHQGHLGSTVQSYVHGGCQECLVNNYMTCFLTEPFTTFAYGKPLLEGLPRTWLLTQQYFVRNTQSKANNANTTYPPLSCDLHTGSSIGASSWFHQSHLLPMWLFFLAPRC